MENLLKFLCLVCAIFYFWLLLDDKALTSEHATFCKSYMVWVNKYPTALHAGCCEVNHASNDLLKEGWKGESLLNCYG
tara:strand:+ start:238 stop:471 length:234 start_codon:yes stop_codon:yes gene_type:complete